MHKIIIKLDFIKVKNFCCAKCNIKRMRIQCTECKNIQANDTYDERLLPKIHRKFLNLYNKKILKI